jgi:hypothetical protein
MPGSPPFVVDDETKTELEDATFLLSLADFPGDDLSWFPSSHGPATCDQAGAGGICPREKEKADRPHRVTGRGLGQVQQLASASPRVSK